MPRPRPGKTIKKPAQAMSLDEAPLSVGPTLRRAQPTIRGTTETNVPYANEPSTATPRKYTPQGAKIAKAMDKFEDVFQTPGPASGKGTPDSPIEIFDLNTPPARRPPRRDRVPQREILLSPSKLARDVKGIVKQIIAKRRNRKR
ncbi:uncharacterized protein MYCFIDRAFT_196067 [Pseudocercospora fijiensis CIRAD86]|uniref:Uncharacterized protein n=1 Tax=Pseudocercospora fijiensis (strain CIRAD86) TaxID=383855 RepID=M3B7H5_PSEFD|nr:uncharacterized protein MYCFIDRAFT_196067 [Pseudocercospora fijiensis CIRAD86]EME85252.1 hypothetical protein MYCFIDRAFT_196067 [Pseudocercospora fijiensis CIRAD86]